MRDILTGANLGKEKNHVGSSLSHRHTNTYFSFFFLLLPLPALLNDKLSFDQLRLLSQYCAMNGTWDR